MNTIPLPSRRPLRVRRIPGWQSIAAALVRRGVTPNTISLVGLAAGVTGGVLLAATGGENSRLLLVLSLVLMLARGFCNILDGIMAVEAGAGTRVGALYNEVPDRLSDVAVMIGAGHAIGGDPVLGWAAAVAALFTAYVRAVVEVAGARPDFRGLFGKPGRMVVLAACMLYLIVAPASWHFQIAGLGVIGIGTALVTIGSLGTSVARLRRAARELSSPHLTP